MRVLCSCLTPNAAPCMMRVRMFSPKHFLRSSSHRDYTRSHLARSRCCFKSSSSSFCAGCTAALCSAVLTNASVSLTCYFCCSLNVAFCLGSEFESVNDHQRSTAQFQFRSLIDVPCLICLPLSTKSIDGMAAEKAEKVTLRQSWQCITPHCKS